MILGGTRDMDTMVEKCLLAIKVGGLVEKNKIVNMLTEKWRLRQWAAAYHTNINKVCNW